MSEKLSGERNILWSLETTKIGLLKWIWAVFEKFGKTIPEGTFAKLQKLPAEKLQAIQAFASNQLEQLRWGEGIIALKEQEQVVATLSGHDNIT